MKRTAKSFVLSSLAVALLSALALTSPADASGRESFAKWSPVFVALQLKFGEALIAIGKSASSGGAIPFEKDATTLAGYATGFAALENSPSSAINKNVKLLAKQTKELSLDFHAMSVKVTVKAGKEVVSDSDAIKKTTEAIDKQITNRL
jgi:hypothetical protein